MSLDLASYRASMIRDLCETSTEMLFLSPAPKNGPAITAALVKQYDAVKAFVEAISTSNRGYAMTDLPAAEKAMLDKAETAIGLLDIVYLEPTRPKQTGCPDPLMHR